MEALLRTTKQKFVALVVLAITTVVGLSWMILYTYSSTELSRPASSNEIHSAGENNQAYTDYLEAEKEYEAHFITLATGIKEQEANRIQGALLATTLIAVALGVAIALYTSKKLIKPVEEAYESQERFIQDAAHELRNPLAAMTASLQQAPPALKKTEMYKTFHRQTKRLIHINEDLLFLEKKSSNNVYILKLDELLEDVVEELQPLAKPKKTKIDLQSDSITKKMSQVEYVRMVKNVIDNAIKYSKNDSSVTITQKLVKNNIEIIVKDSGIGIPKKDINIVGERFFRATNTGKIDGTGLGLAIVQKILNVYGGTFKIKSEPNKGTTVILTLPA